MSNIEVQRVHAGEWDKAIGYPAGSVVSYKGKDYIACVFARGESNDHDHAGVPHAQPGSDTQVWVEALGKPIEGTINKVWKELVS